MLVKANQHIYGNVEKELSPRGVGGFQTLLYTKSALSESDISEIESKTVYHPSEDNVTKLLFYSLGNRRKLVVSRVIPQQSLDRFGRRGGYLSHSFIFSLEDFAFLGNNPFVALDLLADNFAANTEAVLNLEMRRSDDLLPISIEVEDEKLAQVERQCVDYAIHWNEEELLKLAHNTLIAGESQKEGRSIAIIGNARQVEAVLRLVFSLTPRALRPSCTFDTYAFGSNPVAAYFWARGYPRYSGAPAQFLLVNADLKEINESVPYAESSFEKWIFSAISRKNLTDSYALIDAAFEINKVLADLNFDQSLIKHSPQGLVKDFMTLNWEIVSHKLESNLTSSFGGALTPRLKYWAESVFHQGNAKSFLNYFLQGFEVSEVAGVLYETFREQRPSKEELAALEKVSAISNHQPLKVLTLIWKNDIVGVRREVDLLDDAEYVSILRLMIEKHGVPADSIFPQSRPHTIVETFVMLSMSNERIQEQLPHLVKSLDENNQLECLEIITPLIPQIRSKHIKDISRILKRHQSVLPNAFRQELNNRLKSEDRQENGGVLRKIFRGFVREKSERDGGKDDTT